MMKEIEDTTKIVIEERLTDLFDRNHGSLTGDKRFNFGVFSPNENEKRWRLTCLTTPQNFNPKDYNREVLTNAFKASLFFQIMVNDQFVDLQVNGIQQDFSHNDFLKNFNYFEECLMAFFAACYTNQKQQV